MSAVRLLSQLSSRGVQFWVEGGALRYRAKEGVLLADTVEELRKYKSEIISLLSTLGRTHSEREPTTISRRPPGASAPASFAQERFLFVDSLQGPNTSYNLTSAFEIRGNLDADALLASMREIVRRHEILRTCFERVQGGFVQRVIAWSPELPVIDVDALEACEDARVLSEVLERETITPFDLERGPHVRHTLLRLAPDRHFLIVGMHHIVSDDASIEVFVRELQHLYPRYVQGLPAELEPLPIQYGDVAYDQRNRVDAHARSQRITYWQKTLEHAPALLALPYDRPRPPVQTSAGGSLPFQLAPELARRAAELGTRLGCTVFHVYLAAYVLALYKYTGERDLTIGIPASGRSDSATARLIGPFINMLPIRTSLDGEPTLADVVARLRAQVSSALDHDLPFEHIVREARPPRSASHSPLFQVMFALESTRIGIMELPGVEIRTLVAEERAAKYDLTLMVRPEEAGLAALLKYNEDLFDRETMARFAGHYRQVLTEVVERPDSRLGELCALTPAERIRHTSTWNSEHKGYPYETCLHALFEAQVRRTPDAIALEFEDRKLSYRALNAEANRLAHLLIELGVGSEHLVGIAAGRSVEMVVAVLAVLKASAAYVPIDPDYPLARQSFMVEDARIQVLLADGAASELPDVATTIDLCARTRWAHYDPSDPPLRARPDNAAYVIYTSGSTGKPKAVLTEHRAICNNLLWMNDGWPLASDDALLLKASFSFDVSLKEILWPLIAGARLVIARPGGHLDPAYLHDIIATRAVTVVHLVPTMLEYFLREQGNTSTHGLRIVMCGGEALSAALKERFCQAYDAGLLHLYGPTEASIAVTGCLLHRGDGRTRIPLGFPMPGSQLYVVDSDAQLVPVGVVGELLIGGVPLARGYAGRPALTADRFMPDPFSCKPGARLYRTGDLARQRLSGELEYVRRVDRQVKVRGLRIELGEVESALRAEPQVEDAVVLVHKGNQAAQLNAYVVLAQTVELRGAPERLQRQLRTRLPEYMVPSTITIVPNLPAGPNGKVDAEALTKIVSANDPVKPRAAASFGLSALERQLAQIWCEVLQVREVGRGTNFFDVGGHSLSLVEVQTRIQERLALKLSVTDLFLHPTIAGLAEHLKEKLGGTPVAPAEKSGSSVVPLARLSDRQEESIAVVGVACRLPGALDVEAFWENLVGGVEAVQWFSAEELEASGVPKELRTHERYVPARALVAGPIEHFDAAFFGFSGREAELVDPQIRLLLESAQNALDDAGCDPQAFQRRGERTIGTFVAVSRSSYYLNRLQHDEVLLRRFGPLQIAMVTDKSYAATQLAYRLDLQGPALSVDTACSSSLVAVHQACRALASFECDAALAGGASVDVPLEAGYIAAEGNIGSVTGRCRPFDESADGTVKGSGATMLVLKRLSDALADGDRVYAVVRGSAVNNDGSAKVGFTAPGARGQAAVIRRALARADVAPETVSFVETHGTGTLLGDPIEVEALRRAFPEGHIALGAVKANVGHLDAAAGATGLLKAVLALHHRVIPPHPSFEQPNSKIDFESTPFYVNTTPIVWPRNGTARRAGVSSFGIGGTNAHLVLEEGPSAAKSAGLSAPAHSELVLLSAHTPSALSAQVERLRLHLDREPSVALSDVAATLSTGRRQLACRVAFVCTSVVELKAQLSGFRPEQAQQVAATKSLVTFLFPGQGVPYQGVAEALYQTYPPFRRRIDFAAEALGDSLVGDIRDVLCKPSAAGTDTQNTALAQPALLSLSYALVGCLEDFGIEADQLSGHSIGELSAAATAGVLSWNQALAVAAVRGRLMQACEEGAMLAVARSESELGAWLGDGCELAAVNGPDQCVIAGPRQAMEVLEHKLQTERIPTVRLPTARAFHTSGMEDAAQGLSTFLVQQSLCAPRIPFTSNLTGSFITDAEACEPEYWGRQLRGTVRFFDQLSELLRTPHAVLVELGPIPQISGMVRRHPAYAHQTVLSVSAGQREGGLTLASLLRLVGQLWMFGVSCDWQRRYEGPRPQPVRLPGYPFERLLHWVGPRRADVPAEPGIAHSKVCESAPKLELALNPHPDTRARVQSLYRQLVADREFSGDEDFFAAGGSSLIAAQLIGEIERALAVRISIREFYEDPRIDALVAAIHREQEAAHGESRDRLEL